MSNISCTAVLVYRFELILLLTSRSFLFLRLHQVHLASRSIKVQVLLHTVKRFKPFSSASAILRAFVASVISGAMS